MNKYRLIKNTLSSWVMKVLTVSVCLLLFLIAAGLLLRSLPLLRVKPVTDLLFSGLWKPMKGEFGFLPFILGTLYVTGISLVIAVPLSLLAAVYLTEYARPMMLRIIRPVIDVLAGIPSVIFGLWGILVIVPFVRSYVAPFFGTYSGGYSALSAGIVLAVMIIPVMLSVMIEVIRSVPADLREATLSLGTTHWEMVKHVVLRKAFPGIIAAIVLALSRAMGETMAVMMVAGNVARPPVSPFSPVYTLPSLIANNYGEMLSIPLYESALMFAAFTLFLVILLFNILSGLILMRIKRSIQ